MLDDPLDQAIDDVARAMTSAAPDAGFARRMSARIDGDTIPANRSRLWRPWVLAPIAAACVLTVAIYVTRENRAPVAPAQPEHSVPLKPEATRETATKTAEMTKETPRARSGFSRTTVNASLTAPAPVSIAPLELNAIDIAPLARTEEIQIGAIAIDRIEIAAMP